MPTGSTDGVSFFSCKVYKKEKISLSNMGIRAVHPHMKDPSSEKLNKRSKNMKVSVPSKNIHLLI